MIIADTDSLTDQFYQVPLTDTLDICETWTGSDYVHNVHNVGSSERLQALVNPLMDTHYDAGFITGSAVDGSQQTSAAAVGGTAFDFVLADQAAIEASEDEPYYAVFTPHVSCDPTPGGISCNSTGVSGTATALSRSASNALNQAEADTSAKITRTDSSDAKEARKARHGIKRRGVRMLVGGMEDAGRTSSGNRRFRSVKGTEERFLTLEKDTDLLIEDETRGPDWSTKATHTWRAVGDGHVRDRTVIVDTEVIRGKRITSSSTISVSRVKVRGVQQ